MKVLITDDEAQVRKGLLWKIDWEKEGFTVVGEASNGREALHILEEKDPDIVLTDVRMPIMDGIALVKEMAIRHPKVKTIILSGYADFEYVRASMHEGVKRYLLKPVDPEELSSALKDIKDELISEKAEEYRTDRAKKLMQDQLAEIKEQYLLQLVRNEWAGLSISEEKLMYLGLDTFCSEDVRFLSVEIRGSMSRSDLRALFLPFRMICRELAGERAISFVDASYPHMVHYISRIGDVKGLATDVQQAAKNLLGLESVIGLGKPVRGARALKSGYESSILAWGQSSINIESQLIDDNKRENDPDFPDEAEKVLNAYIEQGNGYLLQSFLTNLLERQSSVMDFTLTANRILLHLNILAGKYDPKRVEVGEEVWKCQISIWEMTSYKEVTHQLTELSGRIMRMASKLKAPANGEEVVSQVKAYMDIHYATDMSLATLAGQFHINAAYLSELFKAQVGQNFTDYLISLRMKKAKELLGDTGLKVIDIAHICGFSSSGYFSTVFKKKFGVKPIDYRKGKGTEGGEGM